MIVNLKRIQSYGLLTCTNNMEGVVYSETSESRLLCDVSLLMESSFQIV